MRTMLRHLVLCVVLVSVQLVAAEQPRFIFFIIGDGMGVAQRAAAERYLQGKQGDDARLHMNQLPHGGLTVTTPHGGGVTDSAASGTALACGEKTRNGVVGLDPSQQRKLPSVADAAHAAGMKVGIISSVPIDHATPAAFYAKQSNRGQYYEIATQIASSGFDYFAAEPCIGNAKAKGRPLPAQLAADAGYRCVEERDGLALEAGAGKVLWQAPVGYAIDATDESVRLLDLVDKGIALLENERGFFMMIEGGRIDWAGHANDLGSNVRETIDLDAVVARVLAFQQAHADECLVVITADHETGGLDCSGITAVEADRFAAIIDGQQGSYEAFNGALKRWLALGVTGDALIEQALAFYGLGELSADERALLEKTIVAAKGGKQLYGKRNPLAAACQQILSSRCGASWSTGGHSGVRVATTAIGPGAERFAGDIDNTEIGLALRALVTRQP